MTKDYKNDRRSKSKKTKRQAQTNAQDIKSLWRKSVNKPSATVNERSSRTSPAVAASSLGGAGVREVSAPVQNRIPANEFASGSNNKASTRNRPSTKICAPPSTVGGNSEPPDPPDPPGDDPDGDNNEEGRGVYEDVGGGDGSRGDEADSNRAPTEEDIERIVHREEKGEQ